MPVPPKVWTNCQNFHSEDIPSSRRSCLSRRSCSCCPRRQFWLPPRTLSSSAASNCVRRHAPVRYRHRQVKVLKARHRAQSRVKLATASWLRGKSAIPTMWRHAKPTGEFFVCLWFERIFMFKLVLCMSGKTMHGNDIRPQV